MSDTDVRGSWTTLKTLVTVIPLGAVVAAVALYVGAGPTREEFERQRESITNVEKDQIRLRGSLDTLERSVGRIEVKLDDIIETLGGRQP